MTIENSYVIIIIEIKKEKVLRMPNIILIMFISMAMFILSVAMSEEGTNREIVHPIRSKFFSMTFFVSFFLIIVSIISLFGYLFVDKLYVEQPPETYNIVALQDSQNVTGRMYCRSGYIEETLYYYTMYNSIHGLAILKLDSGTAYLVEDDNQTPRVDFYKLKVENKLFAWFYGDMERVDYEKIYVPVGTATHDFSADLK